MTSEKNNKNNKPQKIVLNNAYKEFHKGLNTYASFKLSSEVLGEDLVQDTFIKALNYLLKSGKIETMKAFLYHILNNLIIDEYRKRKLKAASLDVLLESGFDPPAEDFSSMFNQLDGKDAMLLIKQLPIVFQKIMKMKYVQDLTLEEMSLITGKSKNHMSVQVHRGLKRLKVLYNDRSKKATIIHTDL